MLGQLLLGFIFMIVVFFLYVVRPSRPRSLRSASDRTKPIDRGALDDRLADPTVFPSPRPLDALLAE